MKNKKELIIIVSTILALLLVVVFSTKYIIPNSNKLKGSVNIDSTATASTYKDWNDLSTIDNDYSYSTLIYTKDTKIYVNADNGVAVNYRDKVERYGTYVLEDQKAVPLLTFNNVGQKAQIIITNCAIDKDGHLINAVIDVDVKALWGDGNYARFSMLPLSKNNGTQNNPNITGAETWQSIGYNEPLKFYLEAHGGTVKTDLTYYKTLKLKNVKDNHYTTPFDFGNANPSGATPGKALNYAEVDYNNSTIASNINKINSFYDDIDISKSYDNTQLFSGKEGIKPLNGSTTIYYNKSGSTTFNNDAIGTFKIKMGESSNGIYINENTLMDTKYNINGTWYGQSVELLTQNVNGKYSFAYSGSGCGIAFLFYSPKGYEIDIPVKEVSKQTVAPGEQFFYEVNQYIPNNYYTSVIDFSTVSSNFSKDDLLKKISFVDQIDTRLTIDEENIMITDLNSTDLTNYFDISVTNNKVIANSKLTATTYFKTKDVYNNTLTLIIPVKYNKLAEETETIKNTAQVITRIGTSNVDKTNTTNEVQTVVNPLKLTYDCVTNGGTAKFKENTLNMLAGQKVDVGVVKYACEKKDYTFKGWSTDKDSEDVLVSYNMPNVDTTLYAIYKPFTCDTTLKSTKYTVDQTTKTITVNEDVTYEEVFKNVTVTGTKTLQNDTIIVECEGQKQEYKINKYWNAKTGQNSVRYILVLVIISTILGTLFYIRKRSSK